MLIRLIFLMLILCFVFCCSTPKSENSSYELQYSINATSSNSSLLHTIKMNAGFFEEPEDIEEEKTSSLSVCIQSLDPESSSTISIEKLKVLLQESANMWNKALINYKKWNIDKITFNYLTEPGCEQNTSFTVYLAPNQSSYDKKTRSLGFQNLVGSNRSYAHQSQKIIMIVGWYKKESSYPGLITHEYGHLLGLGDVYLEQDATLVNHPKSVMGNQTFQNLLFPDDIAGIKKVYDMLDQPNSFIASCGPGYEIFKQSSSFNSGDVYCYPIKDQTIHIAQKPEAELIASSHEYCSDGSIKLLGGNCPKIESKPKNNIKPIKRKEKTPTKDNSLQWQNLCNTFITDKSTIGSCG